MISIANASDYDDRIIAIVNDKVILKSEVQNVIDNLSQRLLPKNIACCLIKKLLIKLCKI